MPSAVRFAVIFVSPGDDTWSTSILGSLDRIAVERPHGLEVTTEWFENIAYADGERVLRDLASSGEYDIIVAHSTYSDAIAAIQGDFPEILFVFSGSGNEATGSNGFWIDVMPHEPAYLAGVAAAMMSETGKIGSVAAFPFPNVNGPVNAFFAGARSVTPDIDVEVTYIESWFDPVKAKDAGTALVNNGADSLYAASTFGTFGAAQEADRAFAVGELDDQEALAPDVVITSVLALWDPSLGVIIDTWYDHEVNGTAYNAPMERIQFFMPEGGSDISPLNATVVPADVITAVNELRARILSGDLVIPLNTGPVE